MGQINTNNYPTVDSLTDADLLIVENATNGTGTTTPKQLRENAIGTDTLQTASQTVTGAINELKNAIDAGAGVVCYDVDTITSGYLGGQFSGSANLLLLHLTTDGTADATNGYMMMLSYSRPVARFAIGRLVDSDGVAYKQDVYADNTIICTISGSGEGTESDPVQVVILGIIHAGFMLTPTAVVSDRDIIDGQGNTLSVLAEALTKTASGNPVVITDCAGGKARSLKTVINAIQDLHGYDHPWAGGGNINILPQDVSSFTVNMGSWYSLEGDAASDPANGTKITLAAGDYYFDIFDRVNNNNHQLIKLLPEVTVLANQSTKTFTLTETTDVYIRIQTLDAGATSCKSLLKKGSSSATWTPYSNICPISGRDSVVVERTSANYVTEYLNGSNVIADGSIVSNEQYSLALLPIKQGETYTASHNTESYWVWAFYRSKPTIGSVSYNNDRTLDVISTSKTFTAPIDGYVAIRVPIAYRELMVNGGSSALPYEPSYATDFTIQLGQTVYGADINWDTGVMTVKTAIKTYTGETDEAWDGDVPTRQYWSTATINNKVKGYIVCNEFKGVQVTTWADLQDNQIALHPTVQNNVRVKYSGAADITAFRTFLASNPMQVEYELATPTTIQLTPEQLEMLKGTNRVTIDSGSIEVGYIAKIS